MKRNVRDFVLLKDLSDLLACFCIALACINYLSILDVSND
jgi:hypothetical protein